MPTVTFQLQTPDDDPIDGALVRVFSADGATFMADAISDGGGVARVELAEAGDYALRCFKQGHSFRSRTGFSLGDEDATYAVTALQFLEHPTSTDSAFCRITGLLIGQNGVLLRNAVISCSAAKAYTVIGAGVTGSSSLHVRSDAAGRIDVSLPRGAVYEVTTVGESAYSEERKVPDALWARLEDFLWPYLAVATVDADEITIPSGSALLPISAQLSNGHALPFSMSDSTEEISKYVDAVSDDDSICSVSIEDGALSIQRVAAGMTTVHLIERAGACGLRYPEPSRVLSTVSVTCL